MIANCFYGSGQSWATPPVLIEGIIAEGPLDLLSFETPSLL